MTTKPPGSNGLYWLIGITPITTATIYFAFRLFGISIGLRGILLMVVLLLVIKIALWIVLRIFYFLTLSGDSYGP